jgi:hypothetical protein
VSTPSPPPPGHEGSDGRHAGWGEAPQVPSYGAPEPQAYGQFGAPQPHPMLSVAQPGIIPLRPLTMGEIYDGAFKAIRANPAVMFGLAAAVVAVVAILQGALTWGLTEDLNRFASQVDPTTQDVDELYGTLSASIVPSLAATVVSFVVTTALNGVLIHCISQSVLGRTLPLGELWTLVRPQLLKLIALTLLISLLAAVVAVAAFVPALAVGLGTGDVGATIGLTLLGLVLAIAALLFVIVATVLATPVLVLERAGVFTALKRSWQLTRHSFWRVAGIYLLTSILVAVVAGIVSAPVGFFGGLVGPTGLTIAQILGTIIASSLTTPFFAGVIALLYIDIRIRREGLDAELAAAAAQG